MENSEFVVYGRQDSADTERMLEYLDYRGITYLFIDLDEDADAEEFITLSGSEVPTLVLGPDNQREIVSNPSNEKLDEVLNRWGYENPRQDLEGRDGNPERF